MKKNQWSTQLRMLILINSRINILGDVTYGCQQNGSTVQNVDSMGYPSWVCLNQQMVRRDNWTTSTDLLINKIGQPHILLFLALFLLSRKHKMGCANCIALLKTFSSRAKETGGRWKSVKQGSAGFQYRATKREREMGDSKILQKSALLTVLRADFTPHCSIGWLSPCLKYLIKPCNATLMGQLKKLFVQNMIKIRIKCKIFLWCFILPYYLVLFDQSSQHFKNFCRRMWTQ